MANSGRQTQRNESLKPRPCAIAIIKSVLESEWIILKSQTLVMECCQNFWLAHITMHSLHIFECVIMCHSHQRVSVNCVFVLCVRMSVCLCFCLCLGVCVSVCLSLWIVCLHCGAFLNDEISTLHWTPFHVYLSSLLCWDISSLCQGQSRNHFEL